MTDIGFVRDHIVPAQPAPGRTSGVMVWMRKNLFASISDTILTILAVLFLLWVIWCSVAGRSATASSARRAAGRAV